jgi:syntaxin 7
LTAAHTRAPARAPTSLPRAAPAQQQQSSAAAAAAGEGGGGREAELERQALLQAKAMEEARLLDNAVSYNEALIEERDHGIRQIHQQIGEVNEMFQDLAVLINDQGAQLTTIDQQVATTAARAREGTAQLVKAERSQRAARNKCLILWLVSGVIVALILVVLFGA